MQGRQSAGPGFFSFFFFALRQEWEKIPVSWFVSGQCITKGEEGDIPIFWSECTILLTHGRLLGFSLLFEVGLVIFFCFGIGFKK